MNLTFKWTLAIGIPLLLAVSGCSSIHSKPVRQLIDMEGSKINAAAAMAQQFTAETATRIDLLKEAEASLSEAMGLVQASEHVHALVFSASQNLDTKKGIDAQAAAYLIAAAYLDKQAGLDEKVRGQFAQDYAALEAQAQSIAQSWSSLQNLHARLQSYANKSGLASVDPEFLAALVEQAPHGSEYVETVLENSRRVNEALEEGLSRLPFESRLIEQGQNYLYELMDLLERVEASQ